jgi:hypothetical protein
VREVIRRWKCGIYPRTVFGPFPQPPHLPCPDCGASVARGAAEKHVCDEQRKLDYRLLQVRDEVAAFDGQLSAWLASARGRFEVWLAERERPAFG